MTARPKHTIGMVLDQYFPPDPRVFRAGTALVEAGHTVHLLCLKRPEDRNTEIVSGIHVTRLEESTTQPVKTLMGLPKKLWHQWQWARHAVVPGWQQAIQDWAAQNQISLLHAHDLRISPTTLAAGKALGLPVIADFHENFPDLMRQLKGRHNPAKGQKAYRRWFAVEETVIRQADGLITVVDEMTDRLMTEHPAIPNIKSKVAVVPNVVELAQFNADAVDATVVAQFAGRTVLTYVGHINHKARGIQIAIAALPQIIAQFPNTLLLLAGATRPDYEKQLHAQIAELGLEDHVHWTGNLPETAFASMIAASTLCLSPLLSTQQTEAGLPNKVYQYHAFAKAIVASNCAGTQRYLDDTQGGITFQAGDADDCARAILELLTDEPRRIAMGRAGQQAVIAKYNWGVAKQALLDLVDRMPIK